MIEYYRNPKVSLYLIDRVGAFFLLRVYFTLGLVMGINKPNYTQIPNSILDNIQKYSPTEFKILTFICRKTFGWHKKRDRIAYSQIKEGTGVGRSTIIRDIKKLVYKNHIKQTGSAHSGYSYEINIIDECPEMTPPVSTTDTLSGDIVSSVGTTKEKVNKLSKDIGSSDLKQLISLYTQLYKTKYNLSPTNYSLLTKKIKEGLGVRSLSYITDSMKQYFNDPDTFILKQSHSITFFMSKIDFWGKTIEKPNPRDNLKQFLEENK